MYKRQAYLSSDYVDVKYGLEEAIKYTPVVEVADTSSKNDSKNSSKNSSKNNSGKKNSANDGAAGSKSGSVSSKRAQIANYAVQFVGNRYVYGGTSLTNGADCSGFIWAVYRQYGYGLPRNSAAMRSAGREVSYEAAQAGDIVCYAGHVALYLGGGRIVHASTARTGIKYGYANYKPILTIRRIVG